LGLSQASSSPQEGEEDPWSSFFTLLISFAEMYRTSRLELEEWKRSDERSKAAPLVVMNSQQRLNRTPRKERPVESDDRRPTEVQSPSQKTQTANVIREDILNVFKSKLAMIRQRNAPTQQDDSESDSDDDEIR
jgi:hypothetical protein